MVLLHPMLTVLLAFILATACPGKNTVVVVVIGGSAVAVGCVVAGHHSCITYIVIQSFVARSWSIC